MSFGNTNSKFCSACRVPVPLASWSSHCDQYHGQHVKCNVCSSNFKSAEELVRHGGTCTANRKMTRWFKLA
ncbi:uncharacterized protein VTP21DRAFT_10639 [Calcarisporiella thermophila]|uniref:uncharacterized protein n=1 Tax=Calcarisporiella thermophila TaxID=911321 RepID=UPI003742197F